MLNNSLLCGLVTVLCLAAGLRADTPANCSYEEIRGVWEFSESKRSADRTEKCDGSQPLTNKVKIELQYPNTAVDHFGHKGTWTLIYNQGFEVIINDRKYFAFSDYKQQGNKVVSICNRTSPGWSHDVLGHNWACYQGQRLTGPHTEKVHFLADSEPLKNDLFRQRSDAINEINSVQSLWTAAHYPEFEGKSMHDMLLLKGGPKSVIYSPPSPAPVKPEVSRMAAQLPENFDWRNVSGVNYVTAVRNQGGCGSCYAFSSVGMIENRLAVQSNNTFKPILSAQDATSCSFYSQGCAGGFPYLTAGKYGQDFGLTTEDSWPYVGQDFDTCKTKAGAPRYYTASYSYVGGYYGACNEELMRLSLVRDGPLAVSFQVLGDFQSYRSGIYKHTKVTHDDRNAVPFNPFYEVNHAVLAVGYGVENGQKYWIVKNSWGASWGEHGYFRIVRGANECGIESIAVDARPIVN